MKNPSKILIVDVLSNDRHAISLFLKRSLDVLGSSTFTYAHSLYSAKSELLTDTFDFIVVSDVLPGFIDGGFGSNLLPNIKNSRSHDATIIMIYDDEKYFQNAKPFGVHYGYPKNAIKDEVKLDKKFNIVPIKQPMSAE